MLSALEGTAFLGWLRVSNLHLLLLATVLCELLISLNKLPNGLAALTLTAMGRVDEWGSPAYDSSHERLCGIWQDVCGAASATNINPIYLFYLVCIWIWNLDGYKYGCLSAVHQWQDSLLI